MSTKTVKRWVPAGQSPEGRTYFQEVKVPVLKKGETPPPPPNFSPRDLGVTTDTEHPPILTHAQAVEQAEDKKHDEG